MLSRAGRERLLLAGALGLLLAGLAGAIWLHGRLTASLLNTEPVTVVVAPGTSISALAAQLEAAGLVGQAADLRWTARFHGRATIKAGEYAVPGGTSVRDLLALLERGEVVQHALTIIEGSRFADLRRSLAAHPALTQTLADSDDAEVMARLGLPGVHPEGQFLPDTYRFPRGTTDLEFLRRAHLALQRVLNEAWATRAPGSPLRDAREALVLASIIEKETALEAERTTIAGVFVRRLRLGMRLQTDPTVIYGMGERYTGNISKRDLQTDTPYNTYTRGGLPPTPICLAGAASIRAATHPQPGDALYFVATGDGGHVFSATLEEHNAAVRRYLATLRARRDANP